MDEEKRPYLSSFKDRHGRTRWRFRRSGKTISLQGQPGDPQFEEAYSAAIEGRERREVQVIAHPNATVPRSFKAAWRKVLKSPDWLALDPATHHKNTYLAELFLLSRVVLEDPTTWGAMPVKDMRRRHLKMILADYSATPHKAKHLLVTIRKMLAVALDEEWIDVDPSYKLSWRPEYVGWRAWTDAELAAYEQRWPIGTTPRLVYALALWLGNRRSDVTRLRWSQVDLKANTVFVQQEKTGKALTLPITPMLREVLEATERRGETVLVTQYGRPFSDKSLTGRMRDWTGAAELPQGCTLHGLRKTLGKMLAEGGASTRQIMSQLGHDDMEHAELYSREAEQARMARDAMTRLTRLRKQRG